MRRHSALEQKTILRGGEPFGDSLPRIFNTTLHLEGNLQHDLLIRATIFFTLQERPHKSNFGPLDDRYLAPSSLECLLAF